MKTYVVGLLVAFSFLVSSCSKNDSQPPPEPNEIIIILDAKSGVFTGTADYGTFPHNSSNAKLMTFTLKNNGTEPLVGPASLDQLDQGFLISYTNCPLSLAVKKSCSLKVSFDPRSLSGGSYSANLNFDSIFIALSAVKESPPEPETISLVGQAQFQVSNSAVTSVDFGEISQKDSVIKTVIVKNVGTAALPPQTVAVTGSDFVVSYDNCSEKTIAKNGSCTLKLTLAGAGKEGDLAETLSFGDLSLSLTGRVITPAMAAQDPESPLQPNVILLDGTSQAGASKDIGSFSGTQAVIVTLRAKNIGSIAATSSVVSLSDSTNFLLAYDACSNKALAKNASCQVKVTFGASGKSAGEFSTTLSFAGQSITLNAAVTSSDPICGEGTHLEGGVCQADQPSQYVLNIAGPTNGTVTGDAPGTENDFSCDGSCASITKNLNENEQILITVTPDSGYEFISWNGVDAGQCSTNPCTVTMTQDVNLGSPQIQAVAEPLEISPSVYSISSGGIINFSTTGGTGTKIYTISVDGGIGSSVGSNSGVYVAGNNPQPTGIQEVIRVTDSANNYAEATVTVQGISGSPEAGPRLAFYPPSYGFGVHDISYSANKTFLVKSIGTENVNLNTSSFSGDSVDFDISNNNCNSGTLNIGEYCSFDVNYQALSTGSHSTTYLLNYSSASSASIGQTSLAVTGQTPEESLDIAVSNASIDFGNVYVGQSSSITTSVSNIGGIELNGINVSFSSNNAEFLVNKTNCTLAANSVLEVGGAQVCQASVSFNPQSTGSKNGIITVTALDPNTSQQISKTISVQGNGTVYTVSGNSPISAIALSGISGTIKDVKTFDSSSVVMVTQNGSTVNVYQVNISSGSIIWSRSFSVSGTIYTLKVAKTGIGSSGYLGVNVGVTYSGTVSFSGVTSPLSSNTYNSSGQRSVSIFRYFSSSDTGPSGHISIAGSGSDYIQLNALSPIIQPNGIPTSGYGIGLEYQIAGSYAYASSSTTAGNCSGGANSASVTTTVGVDGGYLRVNSNNCFTGNWIRIQGTNNTGDQKVLGLETIPSQFGYYSTIITGSSNTGTGDKIFIGRDSNSNGISLSPLSYYPNYGISSYVGLLSNPLVKITSPSNSNPHYAVFSGIENSFFPNAVNADSNIDLIKASYLGNQGGISSGSVVNYIVGEVTGPVTIAGANGSFVNYSPQGSKDVLLMKDSSNHVLLKGAGSESVKGVFGDSSFNPVVLMDCSGTGNLNYLGNSISCSGLSFVHVTMPDTPSILGNNLNPSYAQAKTFINSPGTLNMNFSIPYPYNATEIHSVSMLTSRYFSIVEDNCSGRSLSSSPSSCHMTLSFNPLYAGSNTDIITVSYSVNGVLKQYTSSMVGIGIIPPDCPGSSTPIIANLGGNYGSCSCPSGQIYDVMSHACVTNQEYDFSCFQVSANQSSCESNSNCQYVSESNLCLPKGNSCLSGYELASAPCSLVSLDGKTYGKAVDRYNCGVGAKLKSNIQPYGEPCECIDTSQTYDATIKACVGGNLTGSSCSTFGNERSCSDHADCDWIANSSGADYSVNGSCETRCEALDQNSCNSNSSRCIWNDTYIGSNNNQDFDKARCETREETCQSQTTQLACSELNTGGSQSCHWSGSSCEKSCLSGNIVDGMCDTTNYCDNQEPYYFTNYRLQGCYFDCTNSNGDNDGMFTANGQCTCKDWTKKLKDSYDMNSYSTICRPNYNDYTYGNIMFSIDDSSDSASCWSNGYEPYFFDDSVVSTSNNQIFIGTCVPDCSQNGASFVAQPNSDTGGYCACFNPGYSYINEDDVNAYPSDFSNPGCYLMCNNIYDESTCNSTTECYYDSSYGCKANDCSQFWGQYTCESNGCYFDWGSYTCSSYNCQDIWDENECNDTNGSCYWDGLSCYTNF